MHLALPRQKTLYEQASPAGLAIALFVAGVLIIPIHYPVQVTQGRISPNVVRPAEKAQVSWIQNWRELCPLTITREFVGSDGFRATAAPYEFLPPEAKGLYPYSGTMVVPTLPPGETSYHSTITPHCWIDKVWQRSYRTPEIRLTMLPASPAGPR